MKINEFLLREVLIPEEKKDCNRVTMLSPRIGKTPTRREYFHSIIVSQKKGPYKIKIQASATAMLPISPNIADVTFETIDSSTRFHKDCADCIVEKIEEELRKPFSDLVSSMSSQRDPFASTPLILLIRTLQKEYVLNFLKKAADNKKDISRNLNLQDQSGRTALHYASALGIYDIVQALIGAGADQNIVDNNNMTAADLMHSISNQEVRQILIDLEMHPDRDINAPSNALSIYNNPPESVTVDHTVFNFIFYESNAAEAAKSTLFQTGNKNLFLLLNSKKFLTELTQCEDYNERVSKKDKQLVDEAIANFSGRTIIEQCMTGLNLLRAQAKTKVFVPFEKFDELNKEGNPFGLKAGQAAACKILETADAQGEMKKYIIVEVRNTDNLDKTIRPAWGLVKKAITGDDAIKAIRKLDCVTVEAGKNENKGKFIVTLPQDQLWRLEAIIPNPALTATAATKTLPQKPRAAAAD